MDPGLVVSALTVTSNGASLSSQTDEQSSNRAEAAGFPLSHLTGFEMSPFVRVQSQQLLWSYALLALVVVLSPFQLHLMASNTPTRV